MRRTNNAPNYCSFLSTWHRDHPWYLSQSPHPFRISVRTDETSGSSSESWGRTGNVQREGVDVHKREVVTLTTLTTSPLCLTQIGRYGWRRSTWGRTLETYLIYSIGSVVSWVIPWHLYRCSIFGCYYHHHSFVPWCLVPNQDLTRHVPMQLRRQNRTGEEEPHVRGPGHQDRRMEDGGGRSLYRQNFDDGRSRRRPIGDEEEIEEDPSFLRPSTPPSPVG